MNDLNLLSAPMPKETILALALFGPGEILIDVDS